MSRPARHPIRGDDSIQKYMLLSSQQEVLRRRLSLHIPSTSPMTASSPEFQSLSSSPTLRPTCSSSWAPEPDHTSIYPIATSPISAQPGVSPRNTIDDPHIEDSHKLCEINQQIKATLTELLNTDSVRHDEKYRAWVQERLMDAEQQIRRTKRRRSSGSDKEFATSIAEHLDHHLAYGLVHPKTWS